MIDTIRSLHKQGHFRVKCAGKISRPILNQLCVNQGGVASGLLLRKFMQDISDYLGKEAGVYISKEIVVHILWVDDPILFPDSVEGLQKQLNGHIYIIITKNIRYLLWNRGFWCSLNNTYPILLTLCIRCTNHFCDSCDLTDVNPHFIPSLLRLNQNVDLLWRHRYKSRPPAIVTSQWPIVPAWLQWTHAFLA